MKVQLKPFQELAVEELEFFVMRSNRRYREHKEPQAIVLSAPTGAGKTIIAAALIESLLKRGARAPAILWISDSPMLNEQSCYRLESVSDIPHTNLVLGNHKNLTGENLPRGFVHFLNTQKLGSRSILSKHGDSRPRNIWEMLQNTIKGASTGVPPLCIIDEAHRGLKARGSQANGGRTIVRNFIDGNPGAGDPPVNLSPMPVILGISATPQHFREHLNLRGRMLRSVVIPPWDVRDSGLLKERILVHGTSGDGDDAPYTMLQQACVEYRRTAKNWKPEGVSPLLVVQVEDKSEEKSAGTDLNRVVGALRSDLPEVAEVPDAIAHCFGDTDDLLLNGMRVRHIDPMRIQEDRDVKVVLFKTALSTGWDCPRAEILVSWRRLHDSTAIAQLVGRMLRTPRARHMRRDGLDDVSLYVPRYDDKVLGRVKGWLEKEGSEGLSDVEDGRVVQAAHLCDGEMAERAIAAFSELPTYRCARGRGRSPLARLNALGDSMAAYGIGGSGIQSEFAEAMADVAKVWLNRHPEILEELGLTEISIGVITPFYWGLLERGENQDAEAIKEKIAISKNDFNLFYMRARRRLGSKFTNAIQDQLLAGKVETMQDAQFAILRMAGSASLMEELNLEASKLLASTLDEHRRAMDEADMEIRRIALAHAMAPERTTETLPHEIRVPLPEEVTSADRGMYEKSLYLTRGGVFPCRLNPWEKAALKKENHTFWLRNQPRAPWALAVPLPEAPGESQKLHYPDFVTFRDNGEGQRPTISIIEPHSNQFGDLLPKAKGLAGYADRHANSVDRVFMTQGERSDYKVLQLDVPEVRRRVLGLRAGPDGERALEHLYD